MEKRNSGKHLRHFLVKKACAVTNLYLLEWVVLTLQVFLNTINENFNNAIENIPNLITIKITSIRLNLSL